MRAVVVLVFFSVILKCSEGGIWTSCNIKGVEDTNWLMGSYQTSNPIEDTHEGVIATFETNNIEAMKVEQGKYLNATFEGNTLKIFTTEAFKNFENEVKDAYEQRLSIRMEFSCHKDYGISLTIYQKVTDVNNHAPVLSQTHYEYSIAMTIPEDFDLTRLLPISAYDGDFTNKNIYFTIEQNEHLQLGYKGKTTSGVKDSFTSLTVLKNLAPPFSKEFTLVAMDEGSPVKKSTAKITINVINSFEGDSSSENGNENETTIHPPVFSKHLYFANYTSSNELKMNEPIIIKYGAQADTIIRQSEYRDYFKVQLRDSSKGELQVQLVKHLPETILNSHIAVIEIEAENPGLTIPGRTALLIHLSNNEDTTQEGSENGSDSKESNDCEVINVWGYSYSDSVLPIVFCIAAVVMVVFLNIIVLTLYFRKQKSSAITVQPRVSTSSA